MRKILAFVVCMGLATPCLSACNPPTRILVAGDSWAWIMQVLRTLESPLAYKVVYMADVGATAEYWNLYRGAEARGLLEANEEVDIVVLSLGGK